MPLRPFLLLYRFRIRVCAGLCVIMAVFALFVTSAESPSDFGVFWSHFCGCAPDTSDARVLLHIPTIMCICIGGIFGFGLGAWGAGQPSNAVLAPGMVYGEMRFLLTRPVRRSHVLFTPLLLATVVIVTFPAAALLLLLAWLRLVHAPALGHLVDIIRLVPSAAGIGDHPSLVAILSATHYAHYYAASVSIGMCVFGLYYAQRWWMHSRHKWLRATSVFLPALFPALPALGNFGHVHLGWILMIGKSLGALPSIANIGLHLLFAVICLGSCWKIAQEIEA